MSRVTFNNYQLTRGYYDPNEGNPPASVIIGETTIVECPCMDMHMVIANFIYTLIYLSYCRDNLVIHCIEP